MHLGYHGGLCCGIKHIRSMGLGPNGPQEKCAPLEVEYSNPTDGAHTSSTNSLRFYKASAPLETKLERLDRYLEYMKDKRPGGVLEIILQDGASYGHSNDSTAYPSQLVWVPLLEERGFKLVTKVKNSNSKNNIYIYHLAMNGNAVVDDEEEDED